MFVYKTYCIHLLRTDVEQYNTPALSIAIVTFHTESVFQLCVIQLTKTYSKHLKMSILMEISFKLKNKLPLF